MKSSIIKQKNVTKLTKKKTKIILFEKDAKAIMPGIETNLFRIKKSFKEETLRNNH